MTEELGEFEISDEEQLGWEEMVWRLVRPGQPSDVGPLHSDEWFVILENEPMPLGRRVKVWIAIVCESGKNGLEIVAGSHRRQWRFHGVQLHGKLKPQIDEDVEAMDVRLVPTEPGDAIVFHHDLLHRGAVNAGARMRVSLEFTLCVRPSSDRVAGGP